MNRNLTNSNGEETQGDKMQNRGNRKKVIHSVEPSTEKKVSKKNVIYPVKPRAEKNLKREKEIDRMESWTPKDKITFDGLSKPIRQTFPMSNHTEASKTSNIYANTQNQSSNGDINKVKNPSNTGSALYVLAAILIIAWVIGFFFYNVGETIHILLVLALFSVLIKIAKVRSY